MKNCIFCEIIKGNIPSKVLYEDNLLSIIMNINPVTDGHLLIIPKEHFENIMDINEEFITHSITIVKKEIYPRLKERLHCEGLTLVQNNELGQEIKHYHIHLIPRYQNDNVDFQIDEQKLKPVDQIYTNLTN